MKQKENKTKETRNWMKNKMKNKMKINRALCSSVLFVTERDNSELLRKSSTRSSSGVEEDKKRSRYQTRRLCFEISEIKIDFSFILKIY